MRYALALILVCSMAAFAQQAPRVTDSDNRLAQAPAPDLPKPSAAIQEVRKADEKWLAGYGEFLTQREKVNALKQRTGIADAEAKVLSLRKAHPQVAEAEAKMVEMSTALVKEVREGEIFDPTTLAFVKNVAPAATPVPTKQ